MSYFPYNWRSWKTRYKNIRYLMLDIPRGIMNIIRWTPVIWQDRDFDWCYLSNVMEYKLSKMIQLWEKYGHHVRCEEDIKQMKICLFLLKRLNEDNYYDNSLKRYPGPTKFTFYHEAETSRNDQKYLFKIMGKYFRHWWD